MVKKIIFFVAFIFLCSGCTMQSGRVQLLPLSSWWQMSSPDDITVHKGDTLYSLSRRYNIPIRDIIEANNLNPPYTLYVGRVLRLPIARYHTVVHGDTLYSISRKYNVDITSLSKLNSLREPYALSIGQKLALPASVGNSSQTTSPSTNSPLPQAAQSIYSASSNSKPQARPVSQTSSSSPQRVVSSTRKTKFLWPVRGTIISRFGAIGKGRSNDGINIKAPLGTLIKAADAGKVVYVGNELKGFGNLILIQHSDGWITAYAHTNSFLVKKGQQVQKGTSIAKVGSSGGVNIPQLHFEVRAGKKPVNPMLYLP